MGVTHDEKDWHCNLSKISCLLGFFVQVNCLLSKSYFQNIIEEMQLQSFLLIQHTLLVHSVYGSMCNGTKSSCSYFPWESWSSWARSSMPDSQMRIRYFCCPPAVRPVTSLNCIQNCSLTTPWKETRSCLNCPNGNYAHLIQTIKAMKLFMKHLKIK